MVKILVVFVFCLLIAACGGSDSKSPSDKNDQDNVKNDGDTTLPDDVPDVSPDGDKPGNDPDSPLNDDGGVTPADDENSQPDIDNSEPDETPEETPDETPENEPDTDTPADPCKNVSCGGHGSCSVVNNQAQCSCDDGYDVDGLNCVDDGNCNFPGRGCGPYGSCSAGGSAVGECYCEYKPYYGTYCENYNRKGPWDFKGVGEFSDDWDGFVTFNYLVCNEYKYNTGGHVVAFDMRLEQGEEEVFFNASATDKSGQISLRTYHAKDGETWTEFADKRNDANWYYRAEYAPSQFEGGEYHDPVTITVDKYEKGKLLEATVSFTYGKMWDSTNSDNINITPKEFKISCCLEDLNTEAKECP